MLLGLGVLALAQPQDVFHAIGVFVSASLYSCVAEMFVLLGLNKINPRLTWVNVLMKRSLLLLVCFLFLTALVVVGAVASIAW